ncbi:hypothetical protein JR316_0006961 [Psilocybe cubensis]|uniref:Uncharacterized protein n=2 Tax=Psilocybe cubensis TaxID=181762 RepID=A0ACB8GX89_PSICU|nr:hypothetical protein JR316_0006961 [Psilocybe cubensis]KAH9480363.1 hypothetical protein JR316_0006961 [Psilocybe cubensis]
MHFTTSFLASASLLATVASAAQFTVSVGPNNGLTYDPPSITGVKAGDQISFKFLSKNHTLTQSTFATPCVAKPDGVDSGYVPVAAGATSFPEWTIQIDNVTAPLWFYCAQGAHCKAGMVFAINPTAERTFETFLATAKGETAPAPSGGATTPPATGGGATTPATGGSGSTPTPGNTPAGSGTTVVGSTPSTGGNTTTDSSNQGNVPASAGFAVTVQRATTLLAALGVASLLL